MKQSAAYRTLRAMAAPILDPWQRKRAISKWSHHAVEEQLDWDWCATKYNRIALVNMLCAAIDDPAYLEIGCFNDAMFSSIPARKKVGVDPQSGGTVRATSDDFFESNMETFDVVFIDGLHTFDQVHKDVENSLRFLKPGGWIALHDMLPRNWLEEHVPRIHGVWSGDVWKVAFEVIASRDLEFIILSIDHGVGVIRPKRAGAQLTDRREELGSESFAYLHRNVGQLPIMSWDDGRAWVEERLRRHAPENGSDAQAAQPLSGTAAGPS